MSGTKARRQTRRARRVAAAALAPLALGLAFGAPAPGAHAADLGAWAGEARLAIGKPAQRMLARNGVRINVQRPGERRGRKLALPIRRGTAGSIAQLELAGRIALRARARGTARRLRVVRLAGVLRARKGHLTATIGGTRYTLGRLRGVGESPYNPTTGELAARAQLRLSGTVRRELARRLRVERLPRTLGRLRLAGALEIAPPATAEPDPLERPDGAVDIVGATVDWRVRESFVCYMHASGGPGLSVAGGAVAEAPVAYPPPHLSVPCSGSPPAPLSWTFGFPAESFAAGWYDPETGSATIRMTGVVNFKKTVYGIHMDAAAPEVELAGEASKLVHTYTDYEPAADPRRAVTAELDLDGVSPLVSEEGGYLTHTFTRVPGRVPAGPTASPFAGFYPAGSPSGWVTVSFTVPAEGAE